MSFFYKGCTKVTCGNSACDVKVANNTHYKKNIDV